jgi:hypothetical protein
MRRRLIARTIDAVGEGGPWRRIERGATLRFGPVRAIVRAEPDPSGAPGRIRTCDLMLRRHALYPAELRALTKGTGCYSKSYAFARNGQVLPAPLRVLTNIEHWTIIRLAIPRYAPDDTVGVFAIRGSLGRDPSPSSAPHALPPTHGAPAARDDRSVALSLEKAFTHPLTFRPPPRASSIPALLAVEICRPERSEGSGRWGVPNTSIAPPAHPDPHATLRTTGG